MSWLENYYLEPLKQLLKEGVDHQKPSKACQKEMSPSISENAVLQYKFTIINDAVDKVRVCCMKQLL